MSDDPDFTVTSSWTPRTQDDLAATNPPSLDIADSTSIRRLTWTPFAILASINVFVFTTHYVPELLRWPATPRIRQQVEALAYIVPGDPNWPDSWPIRTAPLLTLIAAAIYALIAKTPLRYFMPATLVIGSALVLCTALSVIPSIDEPGANATALCLAAAIIVMTGISASRLHRTPEGPINLGFQFGWVILFVVLAVPPLAVGRWLDGNGIEAIANQAVDAKPIFQNPATAWSVLVGAAVAVGIWALFQLLPPVKGKNVVGLVILVVLAFGPGVALAGQYATEANNALMPPPPPSQDQPPPAG